MWNWQGQLLMRIKSGDQMFLVALHYNTLPWNTPRFMQTYLGDYAQHLRAQGEAEVPGRRQVEREFLQDLEEVDPESGERVWHIFTEADVAIETLHAQLVIFAWHQGFPVESDDEKLAITFIRRLVQQTAWSSNPEDIEEFASECLTHLIRNFHTPSTSLFLAAYVRRHVQAMIARKRRNETYESFKPANGTVHSVPQAIIRIRSEMQHAFGAEFMDIWVPSERTIYDWIKAGTIATQKTDDSSFAITEQGLQTAIALARTRNARGRALARGEARGLSRERLEQIIHRHRKPDGTPDWQLIDEKIDAALPARTRVRAGKPKAQP
jgi:hypothetical protein